MHSDQLPCPLCLRLEPQRRCGRSIQCGSAAAERLSHRSGLRARTHGAPAPAYWRGGSAANGMSTAERGRCRHTKLQSSVCVPNILSSAAQWRSEMHPHRAACPLTSALSRRRRHLPADQQGQQEPAHRLALLAPHVLSVALRALGGWGASISTAPGRGPPFHTAWTLSTAASAYNHLSDHEETYGSKAGTPERQARSLVPPVGCLERAYRCRKLHKRRHSQILIGDWRGAGSRKPFADLAPARHRRGHVTPSMHPCQVSPQLHTKRQRDIRTVSSD